MSSGTASVGQRVRVPWGLEDVEGTVVAVFGSARRRYVRVSVELGDPTDPDEMPVVALPADSVEALTAV